VYPQINGPWLKPSSASTLRVCSASRTSTRLLVPRRRWNAPWETIRSAGPASSAAGFGRCGLISITFRCHRLVANISSTGLGRSSKWIADCRTSCTNIHAQVLQWPESNTSLHRVCSNVSRFSVVVHDTDDHAAPTMSGSGAADLAPPSNTFEPSRWKPETLRALATSPLSIHPPLQRQQLLQTCLPCPSSISVLLRCQWLSVKHRRRRRLSRSRGVRSITMQSKRPPPAPRAHVEAMTLRGVQTVARPFHREKGAQSIQNLDLRVYLGRSRSRPTPP
jgi:hypothetical protein